MSRQQIIRNPRSLREAVAERRRHLAHEAAEMRENTERENTEREDGEPGTGSPFAVEFPERQAQLAAIDPAIDEERRPDDPGVIHPPPSRSRPRGNVE